MSINFLNALKNEVVVERYFYNTLGLSPDAYSFAPRVSRVSSLPCQRVVKLLAGLIYLFWPLFLSPLLNFIQLFRYLSRRRRCVRIDRESLSDRKIVFASSVDVVDKIVQGADIHNSVVFLRPLACDRGEGEEHNVLSLLGRLDILVLFLQTIKLTFVMSYCGEYRNWRLQTYVLYEWLIVQQAFRRVEAHYYIADHFDRWAVLFDGIAGHQKEAGKETKLTIIQHGLLSKSFDCLSPLPFSPPYRLCFVDGLVVFDQVSLDAFKYYVLSPEIQISPHNIIFRPPIIKLTPFDVENNAKVILFIGHPLCENLQIGIYNALLKIVYESNDLILYKPHPTQAISNKVKSCGWEIFDDFSGFPDADIVISYPSTLGYEYHLAGKRVVQHELTQDRVSVSSVIKQIDEIRGDFNE